MYVFPQDITIDSVYFCIQNKEHDLVMLTHFFLLSGSKYIVIYIEY